MNSKNNGTFHLSKKSNTRSLSVLTKAALILSLAVFLIPVLIPIDLIEAHGGKYGSRYARYQKQRMNRVTTVAPKPITPTTTTAVTPAPLASSGTITTTATSAPKAPTTTTVPTSAVTTNPTPSIPTNVPTTSKLCMNYGHQPTSSGKYDYTVVDENFKTLKASGINCLRLAYNGFNNPNSNALALRAKANGMYVILGGDWGTLTPSDLATYDAQAVTQAKWAEANGIPQLGIGNEQEYRLSGISEDEWVQHVIKLADKVKAVYSGKVSYETSSNYIPLWEKYGIGNLDLFGLNNYCGLTCNSTRIARAMKSFGNDRVYVSETNADMGTGLYSSDAAHAAALEKDLLVLLKTYPTIPMYYFAFISGGTAPAHWGIYSGTSKVQPLTAAVLGVK